MINSGIQMLVNKAIDDITLWNALLSGMIERPC